ncbi:hypothetical protein CO669_27430 [Bradyrhizobium sp. Y36]|nr:hypothetical protein CO669_27430 [Bradyrhizobium sp. Y36]
MARLLPHYFLFAAIVATACCLNCMAKATAQASAAAGSRRAARRAHGSPQAQPNGDDSPEICDEGSTCGHIGTTGAVARKAPTIQLAHGSMRNSHE